MDAETFARAARIPLSRATEWLLPINEAMERYEITTPARRAAFIAQTSHESAKFTAVVEDLFYRSPQRIADFWPSRFDNAGEAAYYIKDPVKLANFVYANRNGNGDEASGEGWLYRGRGLIMGTGRDFSEWLTEKTGIDFVQHPDMVAQPDMAALASAAWWADHGLNELADMGAIDKITRVVNGPKMAGRLERAKAFDHAITVLEAEDA